MDPSFTSNFTLTNLDVAYAFDVAQDNEHPTDIHISQLLERGVRALIYAGTYDLACNWISNERWTLNMPWTGQEAFTSQPLREWQIDGQVVGKTRSAKGLTFATIDGAGHMVGTSLLIWTCTDMREARFRMINPRRRWYLCRGGWQRGNFELCRGCTLEYVTQIIKSVPQQLFDAKFGGPSSEHASGRFSSRGALVNQFQTYRQT